MNVLLPQSDELNIKYLGRLFDNTSECYKFFWFKAIFEKIIEGQTEMTYEELVDKMIASAWYMVTEYHLNLGPSDTLEKLVLKIKEKYPFIKSSEKETVIIEFLKNNTDKEILKGKRSLTYNVPYRLQAPFFDNLKGLVEWKVGENGLIEKINKENHLMYYFSSLNGLNTTIFIQDAWIKYFIENKDIIQGWLDYNLIIYLQKRNPNVPGISDKLSYPSERKLGKVIKYWKTIASIEPIREIYSGIVLTEKDISIDHFVPWSYVAHDELWNLNPTTRSINSSKSNNLPDWDEYFQSLVELEYQAYQLIWKNETVHKEFEKCAKEHINNDELRHRIYRSGISENVFKGELESVLFPVYQSAQNCGFKSWKYEVSKI